MDRKEYNRKYYLEHREELKKRHYAHYERNKEKYREAALKWYYKHKVCKPKKEPKTNKEKCREYYLRNKVSLNRKRAAYQRERRKNDAVFRMKHNVRNLVRNSFGRHGTSKSMKTEDIVGCSLDSLCAHLLKTWEQNYSYKWDNEPYHIDHIIPLATAKNEQEAKDLCHYTNLQMLKPKDNLKKGAKMY